MKKLLYLLLSLLYIETAFSQQFPTFDWARVASEGYPDIPLVGTNYGSDIRIIKRDAAGNLYVSGQINKAMKFANQDIYAQNFNGSIYGSYFMKLNPTGETILWVKTMVFAGISDFEIDNDGFIYAVSEGGGGGRIKYGDATIAGGNAYPNVEVANYYKINAGNGNLVWMKNAGTPGFAPSIYPFVETDNNALYTTDCLGPNANNSTTVRGYRLIKILKSAANADPDEHIENKAWILDKTWFAANVDPLFENHIFDMKLTNDKQSLWVYLMTGDAWIDDFSNQLYDTRDMILLRLDNLNNATPTVGYKKKFTTLIPLNKGDLQIDSQGNILVTGGFQPDANRYVQNSNGKADVIFGGITYEFPFGISKQYIAKLSPTGTETWIKFYDVQSPYQFRSLTLDANDNIYVGDMFGGISTIGNFTDLNSALKVLKLTPNGEQVYLWSNEEGNGIGGEPVLCATGIDGLLIGTGGTQRRLPDAQAYFKVGTKEVFDGGGFVLSNLKHSGTAKPFEEFKRLKNINTSADVLSQYSSHPNNFTELGGNLVFFAWGGDDLNKACYLWKTDGTENGTTILKEIYNNNYESGNRPYSGEIIKTPTHLYFEGQSKVPNTNTYQREIWKSDGTIAGTVKIKAFLGGSQGDGGTKESLYDIFDMEYCNGLVYFTMTDNNLSKIDLWKTDGTEAGTVRIYENCQSQLQSYNNQIYFFIAGTPDQYNNVSYSMRRHNGTSGGFVKSIGSSTTTKIPRFFGVANNLILFAADGTIVVNGNNVNSGMELWKSDGTAAGTTIVKDINPEVANNFPPGPFSSGKDAIKYANNSKYYGANFNLPNLDTRSIIHNNILYFNADDGVNGSEVWKSDGTEVGTVLIKNVATGSYTDIWGQTYPSSSDPAYFYPFNGNIYFMGFDNVSTGNRGFHKTDGTTNGTVLVKSNILYGGYNIDAYYNSGFGSVDASEKMPYAVLNNRLYFAGKETPTPVTAQDSEIWSTDGTTEGTKQLKNLTKVASSTPVNMYSWNGSLYFTMHKYQNLRNFYYPAVEAEPWKFTPAACTNPAPAGPLATVPTILASYPATIKSNGCLGIVKWYAEASGGSPIFVGDNYTTPLLNKTTTYYLSCTFNNCESQRSLATVTVNQPNCTTLPAVPSSSGGNVVSGNSIILSAIGCTEQTRWYGQASGGAILAQTPTFVTPILTTPTTYYPVCFVLGCESPRTVLDNITITPSSGQALDFDGTDDVVTVPTNIGFNAPNFTMEAWVRFDVNNRNQTIMDNSRRWIYYNYAQAGSSIKFGFENNGEPRETGFLFTPTAGIWYHLACSFNNTSKESYFYINGELQDVQNLNYAPGQTNFGMKIGNHYTFTGWELDGRIEEARYWNIVRTEAEIGASYNTELSGNESGLVFYYKFDGEATCDVQDCSPNQLHGTRSGATGTNNKPIFVNTSVALTNVACGVSSACVLLNPCMSSLSITSNYTTGDNVTRQASAINGLITATNQITNTAKVTYQSKAILLNPGFKVELISGGAFKAEIGGCN
ncbi:LamG-like jellyroll fold domain-containing protein [Emticicia sp. SJ17W-69]|uniref:Ig-like domain-containing protein n=1 Tax=Emticicia sp. SJ17W-69 TaxID=3421657 RepID=UPI003EB9D9CC